MAVDDLPRETAERATQLARTDELERLLRVKDAMLWSMLSEGRTKESQQAERARQLVDAASDDADDATVAAWRFRLAAQALPEEERRAALTSCQRWPGPICGPCWGASCACGHVFASHHDAAGRDEMDRLICRECREE